MASDQEKLSRKVFNILSDDAHEIYLSIASIWEMGIKISLGKLKLGVDLQKFIQMQILDNGILLLPIKKEHIFPLVKVPFHHRDPFDRLIISQAQVEDLTILTADTIFKKYEVKLIS
jgi:PIN domain nuclease of toxin-antitoxin system